MRKVEKGFLRFYYSESNAAVEAERWHAALPDDLEWLWENSELRHARSYKG